jgi:hypothetical protein
MYFTLHDRQMGETLPVKFRQSVTAPATVNPIRATTAWLRYWVEVLDADQNARTADKVKFTLRVADFPQCHFEEIKDAKLSRRP